MDEKGKGWRTQRRRRGIFWPLILILVGVFLLLSNTGRLTGDIWGVILQYWPLLLILMGLDGFVRGEGLAGATLVTGFGIAFLLSNFGMLDLNVWMTLFYLWPLFLVAVGFDILIGRRSWLAGIAGAIGILVVLAGSLYLMGVRFERLQLQPVEELRLPLEGIESADISIEVGAGSVGVQKMSEPVALITGEYPLNDQVDLKQDFNIQNGVANLVLRGFGSVFVFPGDPDQFRYSFELAPGLPIDLQFGMGAGEANLDLDGLDISALQVDFGVGKLTVRLSGTANFSGSIDGAIGEIAIVVPQGVGLRIRADTGLSVVNAPPGYSKENGVYESPNYDSAEVRITLQLDHAIGVVNIQQE